MRIDLLRALALPRRRGARAGLAGCLGFAMVIAAGANSVGQAAPSILIDAATGDVLAQQEATRSWFPASTTKLMTVYVALDAVASGRITLNTPMIVSPRALAEAPSKMGFAAGTQVTLDNALKMLMVKSANDIAVTIAEGVAGSVEAFAGEMNNAASSLGMRESHFVNPNGLPDPRHVSSARDLAVLARALLQRFPEHADLYDIGAMRLMGRIYPTHNGLLGRYPGADGMKTGFTCAAGFNVVATASRGNRRLIAVVLGAPSASARTIKAASLLNVGFSGRLPSGSAATSLASNGVTDAPDMHDGVCRNRGKANAKYLADIEDTAIPVGAAQTQAVSAQPERSFLAFGAASAPQVVIAPGAVPTMPRAVFTPVDVFVGPIAGWTGAVAHPDNYDGPPPVTATAYAPDKAATETPLKPSADALPMRRGKKHVTAHASAPAPKIVARTAGTQKDEGAEASDDTGSKSKAADHGKARHGKLAKASVAKSKADGGSASETKAPVRTAHVKAARAAKPTASGKPAPATEATKPDDE